MVITLWTLKLSGALCLGIKANFLNIMKNMYREDNYCVKLEEGITDKLTSKVGVKQDCI